jgi:Leucine-rich repeat (LRR) protein
MKKLICIFTGLLFIFSFGFGQESNTVVVYAGRNAPYHQKIVLDLSYQNLREVPSEADNQEIEILILDNNKIEKLPKWIGNLKNLKTLSLRNNNLLELNPLISYCENLEQLYLSGNKNLTDIPSLTRSEKLKLIDAIDTGITEVPGWIEMSDNLFYFKYTAVK